MAASMAAPISPSHALAHPAWRVAEPAATCAGPAGRFDAAQLAASTMLMGTAATTRIAVVIIRRTARLTRASLPPGAGASTDRVRES